MVDFERYKMPIFTIVIIIIALMVMLSVGFTIGILSDDPDGLERSLLDARGADWLEGLSSPWDPILGWIGNDYIEGILGILLSVFLIIAVFALIAYLKKRKRD